MIERALIRRRRQSRRLVWLGCLLIGCLAASARGQAPPAGFSAFAYGGCTPHAVMPYPYTCERQVLDPNHQVSARSSTSGGLLPMADAQIDVSGLVGSHTIARAWIRYWAVARPRAAVPSGTQVPLRIRGTGEVTVTSGSPNVLALGSVQIMFLGAGASVLNGSDTASLDFDETVFVTPNVPLEIVIVAELDMQGQGDGQPGSGHGQAVVDPEIVIDPSFPLADDFELELSPNLWALFLDGFENGSTAGWSGALP